MAQAEGPGKRRTLMKLSISLTGQMSRAYRAPAMPRRILLLTTVVCLVIGVLSGSQASSDDDSTGGKTTIARTIKDLNQDNLLEFAPGEPYKVINAPQRFRPPKRSLLNFLQMTDFQIIDEESPARVEFLDQTQRGPSPADPFSAAYRPQEAVTAQITEAMVRAVRNTVSPITGVRLKFTILTGDNADSQQYNETRWFIDVLDGRKSVNPNSGVPTDVPPCPATPGSLYDGVRGGGVSGAPDAGYYESDSSATDTDGDGYLPDPVQNQEETGRYVTVRDFPGLFEDANRPFNAVGLGMPWYSAFGNHDVLIQGNSHEAYTGPFGPASETWSPPFNVTLHQIATGCEKASNIDANQILRESGDPDDNPQFTNVPPDVRRCFLTKDTPPLPSPVPTSPCNTTSWIAEHFNTNGTPDGHGFARRPPEAIANHDGYYSFIPRQGFRFVVLDTVTDECGAPFAGGCSEGSVDNTQFLWLEDQIEAAEAAKQYVVVFSHHTLRTTRFPTNDSSEEPVHYGQTTDPMDPGNPQNPAGGMTLAELYCLHPRVIAHIAGHEHDNYNWHYHCNTNHINGAPEGPEDATGPGDFWHVSTSAHLDFPQQSRMIEFIDNGRLVRNRKTMSMVLTVVDHAGPPRPPAFGAIPDVLRLASIGREISYNDYQAVLPTDPGVKSRMSDRPARGGRIDRNVIIVLNRASPVSTGGSGGGDNGDDD
jgi:metallophosphoesterase (TIGR03767 family)